MTMVVVTGMPGAGSSTVIKEALGLIKGRTKRERYSVRNYGDIMYEAALEEGIVRNRDELRRLSVEKQREIQLRACDKITEWRRSTGHIIIDTHCTIKTPAGYLPGLPEYVLRKLKPDLFVLIEAKPEEIMERRRKDKTRERDVEAKSGIEEHQFMNRVVSMAYACLTGAPVKIIKNHNGGLREAAEEFAELL
ncbi:MAG: adenylate kinase [Candidatus Methanophagaceae archaeon]|nr:MAG: adenylate kinase [Methanophagales archaeon]